MLHRVLTIDFHTLVVSTMDRTTKPLVWRNHRSRNPSKSGGVDEYVPGAGQGSSTCSWDWAEVHVPGVGQMPVFAQHPLCSAWQPAAEGPRWDLGFGEIHLSLLHPLDCTYFAVCIFLFLPSSLLSTSGQQGGWSVLWADATLSPGSQLPDRVKDIDFPQSIAGEQLALGVKTQQKVRWKDTNSSDS